MCKLAQFACFFVLILFTATAETITGNCAVLDRPFGETLFQLIPGTVVESGAPHKGWCMILFKAYIDKKNVYDGIRINANVRIRNARGQRVGRVAAAMNPYRTIQENDTSFVMEIAGYIEVSCIEDTSVVEHELEKLYANKDTLPDLSSFCMHLKDFNYVEWVRNGNMHSFVLKETDIVNPKPGLRVVLIFDSDKAVAILHRRALNIKNFESVTRTQSYTLVYLGHFNEAYKKKIADIFLSRTEEIH